MTPSKDKAPLTLRTLALVGALPVDAGGPVSTGRGGTLVHLSLTVRAVVAQRTHTHVPVTDVLTYTTVLA